MSNTISVSKIVNEISFRLNNTEYKRCQDKIKRMASLWVKSTNQISKSLDAGRKISNYRQKEIKDTSRAELKAYRQRQQILKADNIRYSDQIKASRQFQASLQKINSDFMKGTTNQKIRSAQIAQLTKQYKALNAQATQHNRITGIASKIGTGGRGGIGIGGIARGGLGLAATGAAAVAGAGLAVGQGYSSIKAEGQQFTALLIQLQNTFGDRAGELSNTIRTMADKNGSPLLQLGNNLVEFVALMKPLGVSVDDAVKRFQQTQDAMQSYGIGGERAAGFQQQLTQALDQGTLDSFKEAFAWAPTLRADLLQYVKDTMKVSQADFLGGLTNGKYNLKDVWFKFLSANESKYSKMASLYKQSSMANDARSSNSISLAIYRIFESSGFQESLKYTSQLLNRWGFFLESNSKQIGQIFAGLTNIMGDLAEGSLKNMASWLKDLSAEDIKEAFNNFKKGLSDLAFIIEVIANKMRQMFPDFVSSAPDAKGKYYVERERHWLDSGYSGQEAGRLAEGEMRRKFNLGFEVPTFNENLVKQWNVKPQSVASNFAGTLNLTVDANVNRQGFNDLIDFKINDNNMSQINLIAQ